MCRFKFAIRELALDWCCCEVAVVTWCIEKQEVSHGAGIHDCRMGRRWQGGICS